jgi:hypothetical protein
MSMNRNEDPQISAMPDSSAHSCAPNASVRLPLPVSSSRRRVVRVVDLRSQRYG